MTKALLTNSRMSAFKRCRKLHQFEYELGIRPESDSKALRMGNAFHEALHLLKIGKELEDAIAEVGKLYSAVPLGYSLDDWAIERETVESLVTGYEWRWRESGIRVIASEMEFCVPLVNPETKAPSPIWNLAGKLDGIVQLEDDRLAVIEHKTSSEDISEESDYWRRLQVDMQISLYVHAARWLGFNVELVLYDVTRKPTIKPELMPELDENGLKIVVDENGERIMNKNGTPKQSAAGQFQTILKRPMTAEEWSAKLLNDISERPNYYFMRREIARLDSDLERMHEEVWDIQKSLREAELRDRWYRTVSRDTCPYCPFKGMCYSNWDPATQLPEGFVRVENIHPELEEVV
jgi:hypothetical protein